MTDGRWTVDRPEIRVDPIPNPPLPYEGARIKRERITKKDIDEFGATVGCPGCNAVKDNKGRKTFQIVAECDLTNLSESLHTEQKDWIARHKRSDDTAAAKPEPEPVAPSARDVRENPIESDPNPKRSEVKNVVASGSKVGKFGKLVKGKI